MATSNSPAPQMIPTERDQNRNTRSMGSLIAVLNRTMDSAPTIPREMTTLDWMDKMIPAVITVRATSDILKFLE